MRIEDAIKQKTFSSEDEKAIVNIIYSGNWLNSAHNKSLKPFGISIQQYNILRILRGQKGNPISVNALISRMLDKMSNASRLVEKLRTKGYVERKTCNSDRRQVDVFITQKGLDLLDATQSAIDEVNYAHTSHLTQSEIKTLSELLEKMRLHDEEEDESTS